MSRYNDASNVDEYGVPYTEENWMRSAEHHTGSKGIPNTHWVVPYYRKDGTIVRGHIARNPKHRKY